MAAEVATSLAPPQGVAATGGAPSEFTETGAEGKIPGVDRVDAVSMGEVSEAPWQRPPSFAAGSMCF